MGSKQPSMTTYMKMETIIRKRKVVVEEKAMKEDEGELEEEVRSIATAHSLTIFHIV